MGRREMWRRSRGLVGVTSAAGAVFLTSCGGCEGIGNVGNVNSEPAVDITLADSNGASVTDADVACQQTGFPTTELLMVSPSNYHCGDRSGQYDLQITWRGSVTSRSVTVNSGYCGHPMTARLALVLSPGDPDAGPTMDGSTNAQDGGDIDSGGPVDAARD